MKKQWQITKALITIFLVILIVPLLVAFLSNTFPVKANNGNVSNEGTELSYFAADKWISEDAQKDFENIAYFFKDVDWNKNAGQILRICFNPGEAARVVEEELHIDPSELFTGMNGNKD